MTDSSNFSCTVINMMDKANVFCAGVILGVAAILIGKLLENFFERYIGMNQKKLDLALANDLIKAKELLDLRMIFGRIEPGREVAIAGEDLKIGDPLTMDGNGKLMKCRQP